jgi:hypothetical protein
METPMREVLQKAGQRALGGGLSGAAAMGLQVGSLMWLRTTMNYQYRFGTSTSEALTTLYRQGGIRRFYRGVGPALLQGPLARFGDTAANAGVLAALDAHPTSRQLPVFVKTLCASGAAAAWRIALMPVDTLKTVMQVEGSKGLPMLRAKYQAGGVRVFYHGALAASGATFVGHYPWFFTYNLLSERLPEQPTVWANLGRNAAIGFCSSFVSDVSSNSIRVIKTTKQSSAASVSYAGAVQMVVAQDGVSGLFLRGLGTRILANGVQGILFTIAFKGLQKKWAEREAQSEAAAAARTAKQPQQQTLSLQAQPLLQVQPLLQAQVQHSESVEDPASDPASVGSLAFA